jgi:hypothetical protein
MSLVSESEKLRDIVFILFQASRNGERVNYNELRRRINTSGKQFKRLLEALGRLGLIEYEIERKGAVEYKYVKLTEVGQIVGWSIYLRNFINGYVRFLDFLSRNLNVQIEGAATKDQALSELIINMLWAISADLVLNGFKAMILKNKADYEIISTLFKEAFTSMSALFEYAMKNIDRNVLIKSIDEAYRQAQREFLQYLVERIDLKSLYLALLEAKERAPEYGRDIQFLLNFVAHLMRSAASKGINA